MPQALPYSTTENMRISQNASRKWMNRIHQAQFGDGYSQEAPDGLNPNYNVWSIQYSPLNATERGVLWDALQAVGATDYFTWMPPGDFVQRKWKLVKDSVREQALSGDLYVVSLELRQVF